ncbi:MAG TPA: hypothetical protein VGM67_08305 [Gemmatimonadaceae bacterium]|jgi:hypothetical protein
MRRIAVVALAIGLAACSNDSTSPSGSISGTFTLRSVNGSSLPYTFSSGFTVTSEVLTLRNDGSYSNDSQYSDGSVTTEEGFWSSVNGSITFNDQTDGYSYQGSLSGNVLTEIFQGETDTYQRE